MRSYVKKKKYNTHVRTMTASGKVNNDHGQWVDRHAANVTEKSATFAQAGALGHHPEKTRIRRLSHNKRGPMRSMQARGVKRGRPEKECICPQRKTGVFAEDGMQFCNDCCGR